VALRVLSSIGAANLKGLGRINLRLYGGWYEGRSLSRRAQLLGAEIAQSFPTVQTIGEKGVNMSLRIAAQLATALLVDPKTEILNTYRLYAAPPNLSVRSAPWAGCFVPSACALSVLRAFFDRSECTHSSCSITPAEILVRSEQKLVDSMLTVDMMNVAQTKGESFAIVSSDDDMWPGIRSALLLGCHVFHVHTKSGRSTPTWYSACAGAAYAQSSF
jgi:uncharacterized LabA/DUF88 family protein